MTPLHAGYVAPASPWLLGVLTLAALGSAILLGLALGALLARWSRSYLLIALAIAALLARSAVALGAIVGWFASPTHHLLEHGLDVVLVALVIAAVYHARTVQRPPEAET